VLPEGGAGVFGRASAALPPTLPALGEWRRRESNPLLLVASEALCLQSFIPKGERVRTGGVEPPQPEATGLQPAELTSAQRPRERGAADRARTDTARITTSNAAFTPQPPRSGDDRS
jgi:hypothetical protein